MSLSSESKRATLTVEEAAKLLGISRGSAYQAARNGQLPGTLRVGRRILVSKAALHSALGLPPGGTTPTNGDGPAAGEADAKSKSTGGRNEYAKHI